MTTVSERICEQCGAANPESASFCHRCDAFLGWHDDEEEAREGSTDETQTAAAGTATRTDEAPPPPAEGARPPAVSTETSEVVVAPDAPGLFQLVVRNTSTIVDSYVIHVVDPPSWLTIAHSDTNLLPDEARTVQVTLGVRPRTLAVAQRLPAILCVRSAVDSTRSAEVPMSVVVPPSGPSATLVAHPTLVRLEDRSQGAFALRLDNRAANHPRRYRLAASDPEGVVVVDFVPPAVDVPAGETADVAVRFAAPQPPPGKDASRQLTVMATDEDGPVSVQVSIVQETTPEPERRPIRLRLEPSEVTAVDTTTGHLDLVVDNRGNAEDVVVSLRGQDPANALSFAFDHDGFTLPAGKAWRLGMRVGAALPPRGRSVTRPFTVVARAGGLEAEVNGTFELTSRPAAIASARVRLLPDHLVVASRRGTFTVELDNREGTEPLEVALSGTDEFGQAGFSFSPPRVTVPAGQVARTSLLVEHARPPAGTSNSRRVQVTATAGAEAVHGEAVFTQETQNHRRLWGILAVLVGVLLVVVGTLSYGEASSFSSVHDAVAALIKNADDRTTPSQSGIWLVVAATALAFVLFCCVVMLFGLIGRTGRSIRVACVLAALFAIGAFLSDGESRGLVLILMGAVLAFVGGILIRPSE